MSQMDEAAVVGASFSPAGAANTMIQIHFKVLITAVNVPDALSGVPLPIEVSRLDKAAFDLKTAPSYQHSPGASSRIWTVMVLSENATATAEVECAGRFLVRAEVPNGFRIAETVEVESLLDGDGFNGSCTLDFVSASPPTYSESGQDSTSRGIKPEHMRVAAPVVRPSRSIESDDIERRSPSRAGWSDAESDSEGAWRSVGGEATANLESDVSERTFLTTEDDSDAVREPVRLVDLPRETHPAALSVRYGLFRAWSAGPTAVIDAEPQGGNQADLPGTLTLAKHPGAGAESDEWRPLLVQIEQSQGGPNGSLALAVWPPSAANHPLSLLPDPEANPNGGAPPLLAITDNDDRMADILFSYIRTGALDSARQAMPALIEQAQKLLGAKSSNPVLATPAAYTLLKLGNTDFNDWIANLANQFPNLPDGAIIYGWCLIRAGKAEDAVPYFHAALQRGLPMYSAGVRLQRDGLSFLSGLFPDESIAKNAQLAHQIANGANLQSELTCVTLGRGLELQFT